MKFGSIVSSSNGDDNLSDLFDTTEAADYSPIPPGQYTADVVSGGRMESRVKRTPGFGLVFEIRDHAEHNGRRLYHDLWLTQNAMRRSKAELMKLGITSSDQLNRPLPEGFVVKLTVVLHTGDDGRQRNRVTEFSVLRFDPPKPDPFAPRRDKGVNQ